ncbi:MAG TPA: hypothetical protein VMT56_02795 [Candidatus Bathyarchaeia archaeon]|nr:hypothetical protein [Candidatus Bathyarchaeia archaeon]
MPSRIMVVALLAASTVAQHPTPDPAFTPQCQAARAALEGGKSQEALDGFKHAAKLSPHPCSRGASWAWPSRTRAWRSSLAPSGWPLA